MSYPSRLSLALAAATCVVAGSLALTPHLLRNIDAAAIVVPEPRPIQLDLRDLEPLPSEPKEPPKRLIDAGAAAQQPVRETDLISSRDTQAQDLSDAEGDPLRPAVDDVDDFDQLGAAASPPSPEQAAPAPEQETAAEAPAPAAPAEAESIPVAEDSSPNGGAAESPSPAIPTAEAELVTQPASESKPAAAKPAVAGAQTTPESPKEEPQARLEDQLKQPPERFQVAAAQSQSPRPPSPATPPPMPVQELRAEKGREGGGAITSGFQSFEANKHALGEYMLKVRNAVEREWRTALHLRYTGVSRTEATIQCSIRPDGTLEFVKIVDAGGSLTYAVLCREAIENAGPFEPFPFDVPDIYRSENLEISWRFSYM